MIRQGGQQRPGDHDRPLTVEALVRVATLLLEEKIGQVWVEGEASSVRLPGSGHVYFVLKDERAQLPAVIWRSTAQRLRFRLEEGQRYLVRGRLSIYPDQGKVQIYVDALEPAGLGAAALALEQLKKKLAAEGLFDPARKRKLPRFPRRVGVVTSPTGAALRDIIRVIERRMPTPILIAPARVQGDNAAVSITSSIIRVARQPEVDVVIVGRGGGSSEDLSAFNDENVVRAIATCPVPVISAVGHEVDVTLSDLAADVRAATPTAAGEIAVPDRAALLDELGGLSTRLGRELRHEITALRARLDRGIARLGDPRRRILRDRQRIDELAGRADAALRAKLVVRRRALDELRRRMAALHPRARLAADRAQLRELAARAEAAMKASLAARKRSFERGAARLDAMSPLKVLDRGYAIARTPDGSVITTVARVSPGDPLAVRVADGEIDVRVDRTRPAGGGDGGRGDE
jgi:exodeoxyribonuclease VII large subunit